jgi:ParB-like chromosome segregation protein Spo0J
MQMHHIRVEDIVIGGRLRALSDDAVSRLAASLADIGLRQPISVRLVEEMEVDGDLCAGVPILVAGAHRLAAAKQLGWSHIDCIEVDDDPLSAELWEIAENLHRLDLTKDQRDEHIRRYAELLEAKSAIQVPQTDAPEIGYKKPPPQTKGIARQIADETGLSKSTVERALRPTPVNVVMVREAETDEEAIIREANAIVSAWNRARKAARDLALEQIDEPVFDRTSAAR